MREAALKYGWPFLWPIINKVWVSPISIKIIFSSETINMQCANVSDKMKTQYPQCSFRL